ncbi:hypothetical protein UY3_12521 [Chelonia mydas]|uniref:Uncharacterized protein n=1 Tax=Chelonia mydas TaxID=8469 RepID=M7B4E0_CHEMY|nr:hypothetical protein UY3_12521 [Chelonia mydas]
MGGANCSIPSVACKASGFPAGTKLSCSSIHEFYQLRLAWRFCPILSDDDLFSVIHAFVTFHLPYSNVTSLGMKPSALRKCQMVQNAAARPLSNNGYCEQPNLLCPLYPGFPENIKYSSRSSSLPRGAQWPGPENLNDQLKLQDEGCS